MDGKEDPMDATHGEKRQYGEQTRPLGEPVTMRTPDGGLAYYGPGCSITETVAETYCGHCKKWIQTNGVMGTLRFLAEHRDGDCQRAGA